MPIIAEQAQTDRPIGLLTPPNDLAARALVALADGRVADAEKDLAAIPISRLRDHAWKVLLCGQVAVKRSDLAQAGSFFLQAASLAFIDGTGRSGPVGADSLRLAALALHHAGRAQRRQERPDYACQTHLAAHHLRESYGSFEELWETAIELGLDGDVARQFSDSQRWYRIAIEIAGKAHDQPERKEAIAWSSLSTSLIDSAEHEPAVEGARRAWEIWQLHYAGDVETALADFKLGGALLKHGEFLHENGDQLAAAALDEALERLSNAHRELAAFGPSQAIQADACLEQKDFTERLLASLEA